MEETANSELPEPARLEKPFTRTAKSGKKKRWKAEYEEAGILPWSSNGEVMQKRLKKAGLLNKRKAKP